MNKLIENLESGNEGYKDGSERGSDKIKLEDKKISTIGSKDCPAPVMDNDTRKDAKMSNLKTAAKSIGRESEYSGELSEDGFVTALVVE
ncbi:hypothetical protein AN643_01590 [Candidatus Epulonipiscioides saccharophilum]|nr:hypothetical protein AN643_01590 [Epulopiscium sp. SCG-B10WGA-EpuloB]